MRWNFAPRRIFVTGLLVTLPGVVAAYILWIAFDWLDGLLEPLVLRTLHRHLPGVGLVALLTIVFLVGLLASNLLGARLLRAGSRWLERIPLFSPLYRAMRDISQVFLGEQASAFRRVALVEWPRPGTHAICFVMSDSGSAVDAAVGQETVTVFLPQTPNPATGLVQLMPRHAVIPVDMSVEEALKLILSGGATGAASEAARMSPPMARAPR